MFSFEKKHKTTNTAHLHLCFDKTMNYLNIEIILGHSI